jgi:MoaA/NifB/PqqE/SkfB family radical SAM enzyme
MTSGSHYRHPRVLEGYLYSNEDARAARDSGRLLTLRLETSLLCNLRCEYCYRESGEPKEDEMTFEEIINIVHQAKDLGARSIVIIGGGEPTVYPNFKELVETIHGLGMISVIITNGQNMTRALAEFLYKHNASILLKFDSMRKEIQDNMAGKKGAYEQIQSGLKNLIDVGFTKGDTVRLGCSFVLNRLNKEEIEALWRFCRKNNIFPNMETMTPSGRAKHHLDWVLPGPEVEEVKAKLLDIDQKEFGLTWNLHTPLVGAGCRQLEYSMCITVEGWARPCAAVLIDFVNVRPSIKGALTLKQAMEHPFMKRARFAENYLQGHCGTCEYRSDECIGCRGSAYVYGLRSGLEPMDAIVSQDPFCQKNAKVKGHHGSRCQG